VHVKSVRDFNVLHDLIIPLEAPSQVKVSLKVGSKLGDPKTGAKSDFHPLGLPE